MTTAQVHVGSLADMGQRFAGAWKKAESGQDVNERHITFCDLETLLATLTPRRLELLRHVRQHGAESVRALAATLGRDYKNVHVDVSALLAVGLLEQEGRKLAAPFSEIHADLLLEPDRKAA
jgi:predicted transcriptional regulator